MTRIHDEHAANAVCVCGDLSEWVIAAQARGDWKALEILYSIAPFPSVEAAIKAARDVAGDRPSFPGNDSDP